MMNSRNVIIELVEKRGEHSCIRGHKVGDVFDFEVDRGKLCPITLNALSPFIHALRYGGENLPVSRVHGDYRYSCTDPDVGNVYRLSVK